jgi:hypothetical protein
VKGARRKGGNNKRRDMWDDQHVGRGAAQKRSRKESETSTSAAAK